MLDQPDAGDVIQGTGGLRKLRVADPRRGKGARGGLRVIYYRGGEGGRFWLFTLYGKDEMADLPADERRALKAADVSRNKSGFLKAMLDRELEARR